MFGNWWNCLNSFVRGCSSRERPSMLSRSWISSSDKSFSESWEVKLAGISNVVSNNEPTIMHVPATITGCRPQGAYQGMERDLLTFAANFYPWMGSGSLKHFCSIFSKERPFVMHQAAKTKAFQDGGNPFRKRVQSEIQEGAKLLKQITTCHLPLFSLFLRASLCKILISSFAHEMDFAHNFSVDFF